MNHPQIQLISYLSLKKCWFQAWERNFEPNSNFFMVCMTHRKERLMGMAVEKKKKKIKRNPISKFVLKEQAVKQRAEGQQRSSAVSALLMWSSAILQLPCLHVPSPGSVGAAGTGQCPREDRKETKTRIKRGFHAVLQGPGNRWLLFSECPEVALGVHEASDSPRCKPGSAGTLSSIF